MDFKKFWNIRKIEELNDFSFELEKNKIQPDITFNQIEENLSENNSDFIKKTATKNKKTQKKIEKKHYEGHRQQLKEKLMNHNLEHWLDYEILEALLMYSIPRNDLKPLAKTLLEKFTSLKNLVLAESNQIAQVSGIGPNSLCLFKILSEIYCRFSKDELSATISLNSPEKVGIYCQSRMGHLQYEQFRVLFLNKKNKLIKDLIIQNGTIDRVAIFPRELIIKALELGAGGLILVHNHPSGDPTPSNADIEITQEIKQAANLMNIALFDHLVVARNAYYSMKAHKIF